MQTKLSSDFRFFLGGKVLLTPDATFCSVKLGDLG